MTEPTDPQDDSEVLKGLLEDNKVNQQDLAERIQTSRVAVNQVLNNRRGLTPLMALKLEAALGVKARPLLERQLTQELDKAYAENKDVIESIRSNPIIPEGEQLGEQ
jgi:addiction module HigA family antidote